MSGCIIGRPKYELKRFSELNMEKPVTLFIIVLLYLRYLSLSFVKGVFIIGFHSSFFAVVLLIKHNILFAIKKYMCFSFASFRDRYKFALPSVYVAIEITDLFKEFELYNYNV